MGLDNGITYRSKEKLNVPEFVEEWSRNGEYEYEVCYWRKCWHVREALMDKFGFSGCGEPPSPNDFFGIETLKEIAEVLIDIGMPYKWREAYENADTIWDEDEGYKITIHNLRSIMWFIEHCPNGKFEFYDSY